MFKLVVYIFVVFLACAIWGLPASENEEHSEVGYCHYKGLQIREGETVPAPIGECNKITCDDPAHGAVSALTCSEWRLAPGSKCRKSAVDLTKPYPECCPRKVCDEE